MPEKRVEMSRRMSMDEREKFFFGGDDKRYDEVSLCAKGKPKAAGRQRESSREAESCENDRQKSKRSQ